MGLKKIPARCESGGDERPLESKIVQCANNRPYASTRLREEELVVRDLVSPTATFVSTNAASSTVTILRVTDPKGITTLIIPSLDASTGPYASSQ